MIYLFGRLLLIAKYTYNANNRVNSIVNYKDSIKESVEYAYNGIGQRIAQTVKMPERPEKKIEYVIDITKQYNNMLSDLESNYYYDNNVLALDREEKLNFYMQDDLGSVMGITDSNSNVIDEYMYDEFGEELDNISHIQTITYTGYQKEAVGDTYFAQARQYSPNTGRFVSEDIIKGDRLVPLTLNQYKYCMNSPAIYIDEVGMLERISGAHSTGTFGTCENDEDNFDKVLGIVDSAYTYFYDVPVTFGFNTVIRMCKNLPEAIRGMNNATSLIDFFMVLNRESTFIDYSKAFMDALESAGRLPTSLEIARAGIKAMPYIGIGLDVIKGVRQNTNGDDNKASDEKIVMDAMVDVFFDLPSLIPGAGVLYSMFLLYDDLENDNYYRNKVKGFIFKDCYPGMKETQRRNSSDVNYKYTLQSFGVIHP